MDCSPPVSSVHGISQARILGCHFSRRSSWPRDWTHVSCIGRQILLSLNHQGSPFVTSQRHDKIPWDWHIICPGFKTKDCKAKSPEGRRRRWHQKMRWLDCITDAMDMNLENFGRCWGTRRPGMVQFMGLQRVGHYWATEQREQSKKKATLLMLLVKRHDMLQHRLGNQLQLLITEFCLEVCIWFLPFPSYKNLAKPFKSPELLLPHIKLVILKGYHLWLHSVYAHVCYMLVLPLVQLNISVIPQIRTVHVYG